MTIGRDAGDGREPGGIEAQTPCAALVERESDAGAVAQSLAIGRGGFSMQFDGAARGLGESAPRGDCARGFTRSLDDGAFLALCTAPIGERAFGFHKLGAFRDQSGVG